MKFFKFKIKKNTIHIISLSCNPVPPIRYGGIELVIANLCEGLSQLGCNVSCYSPGDFSIPKVKHYKTIPVPSTSIKEGGIPNTLPHLKKVNSLLKKNIKFGDIIVFNHADHFRYLKWKLGISRFIGKYCEIAHWMDAGLMKNIIYPSEHLRQTLRKPGICIPHGEKLIFNKIQNHNRENYLFFAGRITKDKGVDIALEAAKEMNIPLYLAGPLHNPSFSDSIISDPNCVYIGELTYSELFEYYCRCKAFVYLTQYVEPFGLSIIEAMAAGSPIITTGLGGTGETVIEGVTGYFAKNVDEIVSAYSKIDLLDEEKIIKHASNYTMENMALNYLHYFQKM